MQKYTITISGIAVTVKKYSVSKSMRIIVHPGGQVTATCPLRARKSDIENFIALNCAWITSMQKKSVSLPPESKNLRVPVEVLKQQAKNYVPERLLFWARLNGLKYKTLTIGSAKTKWGSCSRDGRIRISCFVMLLTKEQIDYVLLHELCHLIHFNHSVAFHKKLDEMLPNHNEKELVKEIKKVSIYNQK